MTTYARTPSTLERDDITALVGPEIDEARAYLEEILEPPRTKATDYFHGRPFGNEEQGRSQVVLTVVRDTTLMFMRSLMRIFFGSERPVEYEPRRLDAVPQAAQATDYVRYIITQDNPGFQITHDAFTDGLVRRTGFIKWWWDEREDVTGYTASGLTDADLMKLLMDPEVEIEVQASHDPLTTDTPPTYDAKITRRRSMGRARIAAIPGEELAWNRNAKSLATAKIVVHTRPDMRYDELLAMGYSEDELDGAQGASDLLTQGTASARRNDQGTLAQGDDTRDPQTRPIRYDEAYTFMQIDPTIGVALYKTCHVGQAHTLVGEPELLSRRPFASFCPFPEPHTIEGLGLSDMTMDLQLIESQIMRGTLDSLSLALQQDTEVVDGQVNMKDLLNPERGKVVRVRAPGMIREITHRFLGDHTLPILDKLDEINADRTGKTKASEGLDADAMQSTTKQAVTSTLTKSQQSVEYVARIYAETGYKDMFKGLLELVVTHQDRPRMVRLRGGYVEVDPKVWDATMDVRVNVALGAGLPEDRLNALKEIAADQSAIYEKYGPGNPLVSLSNLRSTRARIVELAGFPSADEFYEPITPEQDAQAKQAALQPPGPDPATAALAQAEAQKNAIQQAKNEGELAVAQQKLAMEHEEMLLTDDRERDTAAADVAVRLAEIEAKHQTSIDRERFKGEVALQRQQMSTDAQVAIETVKAKEATKAKTQYQVSRDPASRKLVVERTTKP